MKVSDVELYYEVHGEGDPIIFIHSAVHAWKRQIEFFSHKNKVIAYDIRGFGHSDKPDDGYSIPTLSNDLLGLMRGLKIEKATLVSWSTGGPIALMFTLDHPEMVSKLVLIDTAAKFDKSAHNFTWVMMHVMPYKTFWQVMTYLGRRRGGVTDTSTKQEREEDIKMFTSTPRNIFLKLSNETANCDLSTRISKITAPTLIIVGEKDPITPVAKSQLMNREIKGSKLVIIPNANQGTVFQNAKEVNQAIEEFIR